jgi:serine/threonine-protein kinase
MERGAAASPRVARGIERPAGDARRTSSSGGLSDARFIPGTLLAERYRIVGLLGKGGMGEVYRAEDLKLYQPVALKFLSAGVEKDEARLSRLLNEVRIARQISHQNVCRVYDVGEVDGQHFLTMEYVDGEDLATLLRRIGRLPRDKAIQIARQLCAGLGAAHEQGILHRDLKPANVMIDGRGRVRITDFGLAGLAEAFQGGELRAGTPGYMAPEQLAGKEVSVRSDLYSLGLVLYELFTGKPVFQATTLAELVRQQHETTPTNPSTLVEGFDPAVERAILRCLEKEPKDRPASAFVLAAALPGGDPLAAALAAGETPSPEMVADAGESGGLSPAIAWSCLAGILFGLGLTVLCAGRSMMVRRVPLEKPPEALADRAREIVRKMGYPDPPTDSAYGFDVDTDYLRYVEVNDSSPARWEGLGAGQPAAVYFWYRQSPRYLEPRFTGPGIVLLDDPPEEVSGMAHVILDVRGRLIEFVAVPPQFDESNELWPEPDWPGLLAEADLEISKLTNTHTRWTPPVYADVRAAWEGALPDQASTHIRVEAGAYHGKPAYFQIVGPWTRPARMRPFQETFLARVSGIIGPALLLAVLVGGLMLARRNLRLGRGDRRGAFRLASYVFSVAMLIWVLGASHVPTVSGEFGLFASSVAFALLSACVLWLVYIALEPYVRRRWPDMIISWSRLLAGRHRDPLVGRDILIGGLCGIVWTVADPLYHLLPEWLGLAPQAPHPFTPRMLLGVRRFMSEILSTHLFTVVFVMFLCFVLVLLRIILRRQSLAVSLFFLVFTFFSATGAGNPYINLAYAAASAAIVSVTLIRFGLLATMVAFLFQSVLLSYPITFDFSTWYAGLSLLGLVLVMCLAAYGFYLSLAGRPLLKEEFLEA